MRTKIVSALAVLCLFSQVAFAKNADFQIEDFETRASILGFLPYYSMTPDHKVQVAIFDSGFAGYDSELGRTIPANTILREGPNRNGSLQGEHGLRMAQIFTAYMTNNYRNQELAPQLYLYNTEGYANFRAAIEDAVVRGVDVILHANVFQEFGNFDGEGFYNDAVNQATEAGIVWINASGNFRGRTYNTQLIRSQSEWDYVQLKRSALNNQLNNQFPNRNQLQTNMVANQAAGQVQQPQMVDNGQMSQQQRRVKYNDENLVELKCNPATIPEEFRETVSENRVCDIRLVLSWGAYRDQTNVGTDLDLDLELYKEIYNERKGNRNTPELESYFYQTSNPKFFKSDEYSPYPSEVIEAKVPAGVYYIKVKIANTDNVLLSNDLNIRLSVDGDGATLWPENQDESLMVIADNPSVITVGAAEVVRSSVSRNLNKPEVVAPSSIDYQDSTLGNMGYVGSSNAAAAVAAGVALMKQLSEETDDNRILDKETILQNFRMASNTKVPRGKLTMDELGFGPLNDEECFVDAGPGGLPPYITQFLRQSRGRVVYTTDGLKVVVPVPLEVIAKQEAQFLEKGHNKLLFGTFFVPNQFGQPMQKVMMKVFSPYEYTQLDAVENSVYEIIQLPMDGDLCVIPADWRVPENRSNNFYASKAFYLPRPQEMILSLNLPRQPFGPGGVINRGMPYQQQMGNPQVNPLGQNGQPGNPYGPNGQQR